MKNVNIIVALVGLLLFSSCTSVSNLTATPSSSAGTEAGATCGQVLKSLYTQYKSMGKVDMKNTNTLLNVTQLSTYYNTLKNNKSNTGYLYSFAKGLVTGSSGIIGTGNSMTTLNSLLSLSSLSNVSSSKPISPSTSSSIEAGLTNLFNSWRNK